MPACYLAGPMRGIPLHNFPLFETATGWLRNQGWRVISPHELDLKAGFHPNDVDPNRIWSAAEMREFAVRDTDAILSLRAETGDAIFLLPGWQNSRGVAWEKPLAEFTRLSVSTLTPNGSSFIVRAV